MKFTTVEIAKLKELQTRFHLAIIQRSSNPDNFYANVNFLKRFDAFNKDFEAFVMPHFTKAREAVKNINNTPGDFFSRARAYLLAKKADAFIDAAYAYIFSETVQADQKKMFAKEPRIASFTVNGHTRNEHINNKKFTVQPEKAIPDYAIIYSDNSALIFHSFDNDKELQECEISFYAKMRSLPLAADASPVPFLGK